MKVKTYMKHLDQTIGKGYWLGTYGSIATQSLWDRKSKQNDRYADWYRRHAAALERWLGDRVLDCVGVDKFCRWLQPDGSVPYDRDTDLNESMLYNLAKSWNMPSGPISTIPAQPGVIVWFSGHMGIYLGDGMVRESRGGAYGVVDTKLSERPWSIWFYNPFVDYESESIDIPENYIVTCSWLNVRKGPGTSYDIIEAVPRGTELYVRETLGQWGKHSKGWSNISNAYASPAEATVNMRVICDVLNVREEPSMSGQILRTVTRGDILKVSLLKGMWGRHEFGWSHMGSRYVQEVKDVDYSSWPILRAGDKGEYVGYLQRGLMAKGYSVGRHKDDNSYGPATQNAALQFLKDVGILSSRNTSMTNVLWGQRCWTALYR